jgi:hypothetical protein
MLATYKQRLRIRLSKHLCPICGKRIPAGMHKVVQGKVICSKHVVMLTLGADQT